MKFTLYAVGSAVEEQPEVAQRCVEEGHDIASHAYRWIDHSNLSVEAEKQHIRDGERSPSTDRALDKWLTRRRYHVSQKACRLRAQRLVSTPTSIAHDI